MATTMIRENLERTAPEMVAVFMTAPDYETAALISRKLVEERLAACATMLPEAQSVYRWEGKVEETNEVFVVMKTTRECFHSIATRIQEFHPYDVPEVIAIPIIAGLPSYIQWIVESLWQDE